MNSNLFSIVMLTGTLACLIGGPLWHFSKPYSYEPDFIPSETHAPRAADFKVTQTDVARSSYALHWKSVNSESIAPLDLRIEPTDWYGLGSEKGYVVGETGGTLNQLRLAVFSPEAGWHSSGPVCQGNESDFSDCEGGLGVLELPREGGNWNVRDILLGKEKPYSQEGMAYKDRSARAIYSFWTKTDKQTGNQTFLGWSCDDNEEGSRKELALFFSFPATGSPECAVFPSWLERRLPGYFGIAEQHAYFECSPHNGCDSYFLFHRRLATVHHEYTAPRNAALTRRRIMESGWHLLDRIRRQTAMPAGVRIDTANALVQLESCRAFAEASARWQAATDAEQRSQRYPSDVASYLRASCLHSAQTALLLAEKTPVAALPLLEGVIPAIQQSLYMQSSYNRSLLASLRSTRLTALTASAQDNSLVMLDALLDALEHANDNGKAAPATIDAQMEQALTLARQLGSATGEERRRTLLALVDRHYGGEASYDQWTRLHSQAEALYVANDNGNNQELIELLRDKGWKSWRAGDFKGLEETADRLAGILLAQPLPGTGSSAESEAARQREAAVFDTAFFYRNIGFHERRLREMSTRMSPLVDRLEKGLGPQAPLSKAARFHLQEVQSGRPVESVPIGGGFLSR